VKKKPSRKKKPLPKLVADVPAGRATIRYYCPKAMEPWDYRSMDNGGIGGSETHVAIVAAELAKLGHDVAVYAPLAPECPAENAGVSWRSLADVDPTEDAIWIIQRYPEALAEFDFKGDVWVHLHDVMPANRWQEDWAKRARRVVCQSQFHAMYTERHTPSLNGQVTWVGSGARVDLFERIEAEEVERVPYKLIWASDPSRGLAQAVLPLWRFIRRAVPHAELHIYYGWTVANNIIEHGGDPVRALELRQLKETVQGYLKQPGVYWHGRVGQERLYREWLNSGVWLYPTDWPEVCCIAAMEAQCGGAIPIISPWWALRENVKHGIVVNGHPYNDGLTQATFVSAVQMLAMEPHTQAKFREKMIPDARQRFSWDRVVERMEALITC